MSVSPISRRPSALYQFGVALVAIAMLILPCLYVLFTAAAGYWVYFFATHDFSDIWDWEIGHSRYSLMIKLVCSCTPLLVGGSIALFMVKPLFAGRGRRMQPLALDPAVEPHVYEFVQAICRLVGAPAPRRIELDCAVNASAGFESGLAGFFGNSLILTLGLPLVAGLTQRELAGVVAHEFGHFRQGAGLRLSYLIRLVNRWFARVIYERDAWDEAVESWSGTGNGWITLMFGCASLGIWFSRRLLWLLMMLGHSISALLSRQMEYDADRVEISIAGSAAFESTFLKLAALNHVYRDVQREMLRVWRKQMQLPDNLPVLVQHRAARLPEAQRAKIENSVGLSKTSAFDTHPSTGDRVRQGRLLAQEGIATSDEPAPQLFENFDTLSRLVTLAHYEDDLNVPITPDFLIPLEAVIRGQAPATAQAPVPAPVPKVIKMMPYNPPVFPTPPEPAGEG